MYYNDTVTHVNINWSNHNQLRLTSENYIKSTETYANDSEYLNKLFCLDELLENNNNRSRKG